MARCLKKNTEAASQLQPSKTKPSSDECVSEISFPNDMEEDQIELEVADTPSRRITDFDEWSEASSPPETDNEQDILSPVVNKYSLEYSVMEATTQEEFPMIVEDERRGIEVHLHPGLKEFRGAEVLKLSTKEYFRRVQRRENKKNLVITSLRNTVEALKYELITKEQALKREKDEAASRIRVFWREKILEGRAHGGRMVKASLEHNLRPH